MARQAPEMEWAEDLELHARPVSGWIGKAPVWGGTRSKPEGVDALLDGKQLEIAVFYPEAFPMVAPVILPLSPEVPVERRTLHRWHVNGDGTLCLLQAAEDWQPTDSAADLVCKASGWFIEYLLLQTERVEAMTERGILSDSSLDAEIAQVT